MYQDTQDIFLMSLLSSKFNQYKSSMTDSRGTVSQKYHAKKT